MTTALAHVEATPLAAILSEGDDPAFARDVWNFIASGGDLAKLDDAGKALFYRMRCAAVGLDPATFPFQLITLQGKLTLYATKAATEQLCQKHGVSTEIRDRSTQDGLHFVLCRASVPSGRFTDATGAVSIVGKKGDDLANAFMKAETKAKRRAILALCGLGALDESELETIAGVELVGASEAQIADYQRLRERVLDLGGTPPGALKSGCDPRKLAQRTQLAQRTLNELSPRSAPKTQVEIQTGTDTGTGSDVEEAEVVEDTPVDSPLYCTDAQERAILALAARVWGRDDREERLSRLNAWPLCELTRDQAKELYENLKAALNNQNHSYHQSPNLSNEEMHGPESDEPEPEQPEQLGLVYPVKNGTPKSKCAGCNATIYWVQTPENKNMPVNDDGRPHWGTCPKSDQFKKKPGLPDHVKHLWATVSEVNFPQAKEGLERDARIDAANQVLMDHQIDPLESFAHATPQQAACLVAALKSGLFALTASGLWTRNTAPEDDR